MAGLAIGSRVCLPISVNHKKNSSKLCYFVGITGVLQILVLHDRKSSWSREYGTFCQLSDLQFQLYHAPSFVAGRHLNLLDLMSTDQDRDIYRATILPSLNEPAGYFFRIFPLSPKLQPFDCDKKKVKDTYSEVSPFDNDCCRSDPVVEDVLDHSDNRY